MKDKPDAEFTTEALENLCPKGFSYNGEDLTTVSDPVPTQAELDAKLAELKEEYDAQEYARNRADAYPSFAEQFDLLYHKGVTGLKAELKKTKDKYPKPSE